MIKAIIFDCFGVLVGTGIWNVYQQAGGDLVADKAFLDDLIERNALGQLPNGGFNKTLADHLDLTESQWRQLLDDDEKPNQPTFDYIKQLKNSYKIGLLSNANHGVIERKIPPDLRDIFDDIVVSAEVGLMKPSPHIFKLASERLSVKPSEVIFIDDHAEYLDGARQTGMKTILYKNLETLKKDMFQITTG